MADHIVKDSTTAQAIRSDIELDIARALRDLVKPLVEAAERPKTGKPPEKSQFNKLAAICSQAKCAAEITNYLRYQAGRGQWPLDHARSVIDGVSPHIDSLDQTLGHLDERTRESAKTEAWRRYAVFLTRAFTYQDAVERAATRANRQGGRRDR